MHLLWLRMAAVSMAAADVIIIIINFHRTDSTNKSIMLYASLWYGMANEQLLLISDEYELLN